VTGKLVDYTLRPRQQRRST